VSEGPTPWQRVAAFGRSLRRRLRLPLVLTIALALVALIAAGLWVKSLVTPVHMIGQPTASVAPLPMKSSSPTPTPTPSPSAPVSAVSPTPSPSTKTMKSSGTFTVAAVDINAVSSSGTLRRFAVRVETTTGLKADKVATQIAGVLNDPRSWTGSGSVRFALVADPAEADFTVSLSSPATAAKSCQLASGSCSTSTEVVLDALAWKTTAATYAGNASGWQSYLINHGAGTWLGKKTANCSKAGKTASVMMAQQTSLGGCIANPWPYP
jgi:hypothetical protein